MTGRTMISNSCASRRRRCGPLVLLLLLCAACLQALHFSTFVGPSSLPEQRVAGGVSQHVFVNVDGRLSAIGSPALRQRQQSAIVRRARGGGLISWLRDAKTDQREKALQAAFEYFDDDSCGMIHKDDLKAVAKKKGLSTSETIIELFLRFDANGDQEIEFDEFKDMVKEVEKLREDPSKAEDYATWDSLFDIDPPKGGGLISWLRDANADQREKALKAAFEYFDDDSCGMIHKDDLKAVAKKKGLSTSETIIELFLRFDANGDQEIEYDEFKDMVKEVEKLREDPSQAADYAIWDGLFDIEPPK